MAPPRGCLPRCLSLETGVPLPTAQKLVGGSPPPGCSNPRAAAGAASASPAPRAISLADIVEAVEGPIAMTICVEDGRHDCALESACRVKPHWAVVNGAVRGALCRGAAWRRSPRPTKR